MKHLNLFSLFLGFAMIVNTVNAQNAKLKAAFLSLDVKGYNIELSNQANSMARISIEQTNIYEMLDRYDIQYVAEKASIKTEGCYGKICLVETGKALKVAKMITGSIENLGDKAIITMKIYDVEKDMLEKTVVKEFLNISKEMPLMVKITVNDLFGIANDQATVNKLTNKNELESALNNPNKLLLRTDGPRMGATFFTGEQAKILQDKREFGGYDAIPVMFQFGYQFEKQYLNEGDFQALFEFIPMVTGLDQGFFIPSFTIMNGIRNNRTGWELAFGPTMSIVKKTYGFNDPTTGKWVNVSNSSDSPNKSDYPNAPDVLERRLDSRGTPIIQTGFIIAAGKTIKSGNLNLPVNLFMIPGKNSFRFGLSVGYNSKERVQSF
jgi:hypothetical protein